MISIVVVTYNSEKTVIETLDSIYNQSYNCIELIVADDGSKDNTLDVTRKWLEKYKSRFNNVKIIESVNTGVTKNCNRGIHASNGKYIQIIAGDDILLPNAMEIKSTYMNKHSVGVVFSRVEPFGENVESVRIMKDFCESGYSIIKKGYECQKNQIIQDNYIAGPSGGFYRTEFIKSIGGYDERYPMLEDYPFIYHYILGGNNIEFIDKVLAKYRISNDSLCMKKGTPMDKSQVDFFFHERLLVLLKHKKYKVALKQTIRFTKKEMMYIINKMRKK